MVGIKWWQCPHNNTKIHMQILSSPGSQANSGDLIQKTNNLWRPTKKSCLNWTPQICTGRLMKSKWNSYWISKTKWVWTFKAKSSWKVGITFKYRAATKSLKYQSALITAKGSLKLVKSKLMFMLKIPKIKYKLALRYQLYHNKTGQLRVGLKKF